MLSPRLGVLGLLLIGTGCGTPVLHDGAVGDLVLSMTGEGVHLRTEADYPCANHSIVVGVSSEEELVEIAVRGVGEVDRCLGPEAPASVLVPYPEGMELRIYDLVIEKGGAVDRFRQECGIVECSFGPLSEPAFTRLDP